MAQSKNVAWFLSNLFIYLFIFLGGGGSFHDLVAVFGCSEVTDFMSKMFGFSRVSDS